MAGSFPSTSGYSMEVFWWFVLWCSGSYPPGDWCTVADLLDTAPLYSTVFRSGQTGTGPAASEGENHLIYTAHSYPVPQLHPISVQPVHKYPLQQLLENTVCTKWPTFSIYHGCCDYVWHKQHMYYQSLCKGLLLLFAKNSLRHLPVCINTNNGA